jgi:hypothetical protein
MSKILTLHEMYEVYRYLENGLNTIRAETSLDDFAVGLLEELKSNPEFYLRILELFTGKQEDDIVKMTAPEALLEFMEGLQENRILSFHGMFQELSKDYGPF